MRGIVSTRLSPYLVSNCFELLPAAESRGREGLSCSGHTKMEGSEYDQFVGFDIITRLSRG